MWKGGGWFSAVDKALFSRSSKKKDQRKWLGRRARGALDAVLTPGVIETVPPPQENLKLAHVEDDQSKHAYSVALATAVAAEEAIAAAQATEEVVRLTSAGRYSGKSKEEIAAIKIQTIFRGYMARTALRALRRLVRLKTFIEGQSIMRQAATTLRCMQMLSRLQLQVHSRRIRMPEENQALQQQLPQKQEKEIETLRHAVEEQMEANLLFKQEAAIKRERALAYAFSHQKTWKNSKSVNQTFMEPNNTHWDWSWLERPWETRASLKSDGLTSATSVGELNRSNSSRDDQKKPSLLTPKPNRAWSQYYSPSTPTSNNWRSMFSVQSEMVRRHSIAGSSSVRDDESLTSTPAIPSYMTPTTSAKAKSQVASPLRVDDKTTTTRKRLSFTSSPGRGVGGRRHSGPPKVQIGIIQGLGM